MSSERRAVLLLGVFAMLGTTGCPQYGMVDDGTSISYGPSNRGKLINPTKLPARGEGFVIPQRWARRGLNYGTDELVSLIVYAGRRLAAQSPGAVIGVADLSLRHGGPSAWHRSHQTGRDADLLFFATDAQGQPVQLDTMLRFDAEGRAVHQDGAGEQVILFDVIRNWLLVRALIDNPIAEVQYLFVSDPLRQLLIEHAQDAGEPEEVVLQASYLLHQPRGALPHDDHFHVRIYCPRTDRVAGCRDAGPLRWTKKDYKYPRDRSADTAVSSAMKTAMLAPMPAMMALGVFPILP